MTQNLRGGELLSTYTQGQYIVEGHIEKTEHFEPEQSASGVDAALKVGESSLVLRARVVLILQQQDPAGGKTPLSHLKG